MKRSRWLIAATVALWCFRAVEVFADSTGTVDVKAGAAGATGGSFRIRYLQNGNNGNNNSNERTVTNIATTAHSFAGIKKGSSYTIDNIQASIGGYAYTGPAIITGTIPNNGHAVTVTLAYEVQAPVVALSVSPDGCARVTAKGAPGQTFCIQATDSLTSPNWTTLCTNAISVDGTCCFSDATHCSSRFYRTMIAKP